MFLCLALKELATGGFPRTLTLTLPTFLQRGITTLTRGARGEEEENKPDSETVESLESLLAEINLRSQVSGTLRTTNFAERTHVRNRRLASAAHVDEADDDRLAVG